MKKAPILGCFCASLSHDGEALIIHKTNKINSLYVFFYFISFSIASKGLFTFEFSTAKVLNRTFFYNT